MARLSKTSQMNTKRSASCWTSPEAIWSRSKQTSRVKAIHAMYQTRNMLIVSHSSAEDVAGMAQSMCSKLCHCNALPADNGLLSILLFCKLKLHSMRSRAATS